jgi:ADP-ribosyl-[dinitrogen reductase] hydrolase
MKLSRDKFRGCLIGLAVGDAIGATNEFRPRAECDVRDMVGGGPWKLAPGEWTDDTGQAFALADSIVRCDGFHPPDMMRSLSAWERGEKYVGRKGCFDIGPTSRAAIGHFRETGRPFAGIRVAESNGCLMRLAPVAMWAATLPERDRINVFRDSARLTHGSEVCAQATVLLGELLVVILTRPDASIPDAAWPTVPALADMLDRAVWCDDAPGRVRSSINVVDTLEAAMWAAQTREADASHPDGPFAAAVLRAANLGGDADTVAAVTGQFVGADVGYSAIPVRWRMLLDRRDDLLALADGLFDMASERVRFPEHAPTLGEAGA